LGEKSPTEFCFFNFKNFHEMANECSVKFSPLFLGKESSKEKQKIKICQKSPQLPAIQNGT
jgi:hypothetical protein